MADGHGGARTCNKCTTVRPLSDFSPRQDGACGGYCRVCKPCKRIQIVQYRRNNLERSRQADRDRYKADPIKRNAPRQRLLADPVRKEALRRRARDKQYGFAPGEFDEMVVVHGERCAICATYGDLVIDHDHQTGRVRGLLCNNCNLALGLLGDNTDVIDSAGRYLRERSESWRSMVA